MSGFRKYGRKAKSCIVTISNDDLGEYTLETKDVSADGVFIQSYDLSQKISVGDAVNARLFADSKNMSESLMYAVRTTSEGVAFSFDSLN